MSDVEVERVLGELLHDVSQASMRRVSAEAKTNPRKHKFTTVFEKPLSYRYGGYVLSRGKKISYCWSCHRNVAGFFLGWREISYGNTVKRDNFTARRVKKRLKELQLRRMKAHQDRLKK